MEKFLFSDQSGEFIDGLGRNRSNNAFLGVTFMCWEKGSYFPLGLLNWD